MGMIRVDEKKEKNLDENLEEKAYEEDLEGEKPDNNKFKNELGEWLKSLVIAVIIAMFIKTFLFNTTYVLGNSMYPTLHEKDRLIANIFTLYTKGPKRGDIVLLDAPDVAHKKYIKRVIGLPGDTIEILDGRVYRNGKLLEEEYIEKNAYTHTYNEYKWEIKEGEVFVLGDNREEGASKDSRFFGTIEEDSIKGIAKFRFYPFDSRFGNLK